MENRSEFENKKIYDAAIERLESSLTSKDAMKEAIEKLLSLGDFLDSKQKAEYYANRLERIIEEEDERNKKRKAGRVLQVIFLGMGIVLATLIITIVALAVREAF